MIKHPRGVRSAGFTLVELAVVIVIIGVLAAFAVPRFRNAVERSKAGEAFNYLSAVRAAQERYHSWKSSYADATNELDIKMPDPKYFTMGNIEPGSTSCLESSWKMTLTRAGASAGYGAYTVIYTEEGYDSNSSTISNDISPMGG
jgi:prepilin-type N-terminal cleavage/methylation domain-containing protein